MRIAASLLISLVAGQCLAQANHHHEAQKPSRPEAEFDGRAGVVTGYVRDVACLFRNEHAGAPSDEDALVCAVECVRNGSPIVILTGQGEMYFVISEVIPDKSELTRLLPYVGKLVRASGRTFERAGARAIAIESLEAVTKKPEGGAP